MPPRPSPRFRVARTIDIHATDSKIAREIEKLKHPEISISTGAAEAILTYVHSKEGALSRQRTLGYLVKLRLCAQYLGEDFLAPTRATPTRFAEVFRGKQAWTLMSMKGVLMPFWRWRFEQAGKDMPSWLRIPLSKRNTNHKDEADVLTPDEVAQLAGHAMNLRDKALISTLYESGARIGEVLGLRVGDVEPTAYGGVRLHLPFGKTGKRLVPLFESSVPAILAWLKAHPSPEDRKAPFWVGIQATERWGQPISYNAVRKVFREAARRAGIAKPVNPHNFRHSRATALAKDPKISTSIFEKLLGWAPGSPMAKTYVHLSGREVEDAMLRAHGIEEAPLGASPPRLPVLCGRCRSSNESGSRFCSQCGGPLDAATAVDLEDRRQKADRLADLLEDPSVKRVLVRRLATLMDSASTRGSRQGAGL
jgi:integrase